MLPAPEQSAHCKCNFCKRQFLPARFWDTADPAHVYLPTSCRALLTSGLPALLPADLYYLFSSDCPAAFCDPGYHPFPEKLSAPLHSLPQRASSLPPPDALQSRAGSADRSVLPAASLHLPVSACRATLLPHSIHFPGQRLLSERRASPNAIRRQKRQKAHLSFPLPNPSTQA